MLLEKFRGPPLPLTSPPGQAAQDAELTTAGDISPDGRRLAISTYSYIHEWQLPSGQSLKDALKNPPASSSPRSPHRWRPSVMMPTAIPSGSPASASPPRSTG